MPPASPVAFLRGDASTPPRLTFEVHHNNTVHTFTLAGAELKKQAAHLIGQAKDNFKNGISFDANGVNEAFPAGSRARFPTEFTDLDTSLTDENGIWRPASILTGAEAHSKATPGIRSEFAAEKLLVPPETRPYDGAPRGGKAHPAPEGSPSGKEEIPKEMKAQLDALDKLV